MTKKMLKKMKNAKFAKNMKKHEKMPSGMIPASITRTTEGRLDKSIT